jgi:hypothetical protein
MAENSASARRKGQKTGVSQPRICASVNDTMARRSAAASPPRRGWPAASAEVVDQRAQHPGSGNGQHGHGGDDLGHEAQRGFVDLRGRLEDADHQADHQHRGQHRCGHQQQQHQALLAGVEDLLRVHHV